MSLPTRGTGLLTGSARTERGLGTSLTETERLERHYATGAYPAYRPLWVAGLALASGLLILLVFKKT